MATNYGTNDIAITTNDLVKRFEPTLVQRLQEEDAFSPFFKEMPKPDGVGRTMNFEISATSNAADRQPPLSPRRGQRRKAYEVEVVINDKEVASYPIAHEKIREGRIAEAEQAVMDATEALITKRNQTQGDCLLADSVTNATTGTPQDLALPSVGQTARWWGTNDTQAPPDYGTNTFSAGHDHIETAVTALTLARIRDVYMPHMLEHGYGRQGFVMMIQTAEEKTILGLAQTTESNQTLNVKLREEFQRSGRAGGINGLFGLEIIVNEFVPSGVVGLWDRNLAGLPQGGAVKVTELYPVTDTDVDKNIKATWFEAMEQYGVGCLHKGAGYVAHVV